MREAQIYIKNIKKNWKNVGGESGLGGGRAVIIQLRGRGVGG